MASMVIFQLVCFTLLHLMKANIFTGMVGLDAIKTTHTSIITNLEQYLENEEKRLEKMRKLLLMYQSDVTKMDDMVHYVGNPMNFFTVIKRLTADLEYLEYLAKQPSEFKKDPDIMYPTNEDLEGAVMGLERVQIVYGLNTTQMANGVLSGTYSYSRDVYEEHVSPADISDCYIMGRTLFIKAEHRKSAEWFMEALSRFNDSDDRLPFDRLNIYGHLRNCYHEIGDYENAKHWSEKMYAMSEITRNNEHEIKLYDSYKEIIANNTANGIIHQVYSAENDPSIVKFFPRVCRGDIPLPEDIRKDLTCYYLKGPHPFLNLAPIKSEQLFNDPEIMFFHDVLSDEEIRAIQETSTPKLARATVQDPVTGDPLTADYRITKTAWLDDKDLEAVARVSQRVSDFSALSTVSAEQLQIASYGIGGHYEAHYDFLRGHVIRTEVGNRIATILFYMTDVEQGGATAFVDLNLTVFPKKGAALMWWDLHRSGEPDFRTRHTACPVMRGSKWVCNKWLHQIGQEFLSPCDLEYQSTEHDPWPYY